MNRQFLILVAALTAGIGVMASRAATANAQTTAASSGSSHRTAWGDPDLQGVWTNTTTTPLERPARLAGKAVLTSEEAAEYAKREADSLNRPNPRKAGEPCPEEFPFCNEAPLAYEFRIWFDRGTMLKTKQTSLVVEPPDGRLPSLTPEGQKRQAERAAARKASPADGPEDRSVYERCITRGLPGAMMPGFYNHNYQILQTPGYVAILVEMIHDVRIIPLDGRPRLGRSIRHWLGDSRGRWEGDTLVVETTNFRDINERSITVFGTSATGRVVERFRRVTADTIDYRVTVDDPAIYVKPWTAAIAMTKDRAPDQIFEYACHEGNYGMVGILSAQRAEEKAAGEATKRK
jgi:hypothetical protein